MKYYVTNALFLLFFLASTMAQNIRYVKQDGVGPAAGATSWATASKDLQAVIEASSSGDEIRVAAGVYNAPAGNGFTIKQGVNVYGSFDGSDNYDPHTQVPDTSNKTQLVANGISGGRVLTQSSDFSVETVWSGFMISGGDAGKAILEKSYGGGAYIQGKMTFLYSTFSENSATYGSGVYNFTSGKIAHCSFVENSATYGGGVYSNDGDIVNSIFIGNKVSDGGGVWTNTGDVVSCLFSGNTASNIGGGIYSNVGNISNCTFDQNTAASFGAIYHLNGTITNCILWDNQAVDNPQVANAKLSYSIIKDWTYGGTEISTADPLFIDSENQNYNLSPCSPAVNKGKNGALSGVDSLDLNGDPRIYQDTVDMGAYEYQGGYAGKLTLYVNAMAKPGGDGSTPQTAFRNLDAALNFSGNPCIGGSPDTIYVAAGTYIAPTSDGFIIPAGVQVYGCFNNTFDNYHPLTDIPDTVQYKTILVPSAHGGRVLTQVVPFFGEEEVQWSGFVVMNGDASLANALQLKGGGAYIQQGCTFSYFTFIGNKASNGGGLYTFFGNVTHSIFVNNIASNGGGGLYNNMGLVTSCLFIQNKANIYGGGAFNGIFSKISRCIFMENEVQSSGNVGDGGGIFNDGDIFSSLFLRNKASHSGGGIYNRMNSLVVNCTYNNNQAQDGGGVYSDSSTDTIVNCIIWDNTTPTGESSELGGNYTNVSYSIIKDWVLGGKGNMGDNPAFIDPANDNLNLLSCSPAINKGNDAVIPANETLDLVDDLRIYNSIVDMGCYEYQGIYTELSDTILYVNALARPGGDGSEPDRAFRYLQDAFLAIGEPCTGISVKNIYVARGSYTANSGDGFIIPTGVSVYGCFNPAFDNYNPFTDLPDTAAYKTILHGNPSGGRVLTQWNDFSADQAVIWSGFTITNGNADKANTNTGNGGGAYIMENTTLRYCTLTNNTAGINGGGINNNGGSLINSIIINNTAQGNGGGIFEAKGGVVANCKMLRNTANGKGGGVFDNMSKVVNCLINTNQAVDGGGVYHNGGSITNSTITGNAADNGGGVYYDNINGAVKNTIIWGNAARVSAPEIQLASLDRVSNSIIEGWIIGGTANRNANPLFADPSNDNFRLTPCSPAINSGNNDAINTVGVPLFDLDGNPRIHNTTVDIGAYEYLGIYDTARRLYVNASIPAEGNGLSAASAFKGLEAAVSLANCISTVKEIYVAAGTYEAPAGDGFMIPKAVSVYGSFNAVFDNYIPHKTAPDTANYKTLLHAHTAGGRILTQQLDFSLGEEALWSGFTLTGGDAASAVSSNGFGGGASIKSNTTLQYMIFQQNTANHGGGVYTQAGIIGNSIFMMNTAGTAGGGAAGTGKIKNCSFFQNRTTIGDGGGIFASGSTTIINGLFVNNMAEGDGGAIYALATTQIINNTITGNESKHNCGGIFTIGATLVNNIIWDNSAVNSDAEINNNGTISYNIIQGWSNGGTGNITTDPLFTDPGNGNYQLLPCSQAINAGDNMALAVDDTLDLAGKPRIYKGDSQLKVDIGAYEYQGTVFSAQTLYVNALAKPGGDGITIGTALQKLEEALDIASNCITVQEIWVATGTYTAPAGDGFIIPKNTKVYGGFNASFDNYNPALDQSDSLALETILQAHPNGGRVLTQLYDFNVGEESLWSRFTLSGGNAGSAATQNGNGGGAYLMQNTHFLFVVITRNSAPQEGGGIYNNRGTVVNCSFNGNHAEGNGGGIYNNGTLINSTFFGNNSNSNGGGIFSLVSIMNCTSMGNVSTNAGGGVYNQSGTLTNSIIAKNKSINTISANEVHANNENDITYCIIKNWTGGGSNNINADPLLVNDIGNDFRLTPCSPAINTGNTAAIAATGITTDKEGKLRVFNGTVDIGAYEYHGEYLGITRLYVNALARPGGDGSTPGTALQTVDAALNLAASGTCYAVNEIYVAAGNYTAPAGDGFRVVKGVKVYGGFNNAFTNYDPQNAIADFDQYKTVLQANPVGGRVLTQIAPFNAGEEALWSGFAIINGNAAYATTFPDNGGGALINNTQLSYISFEGNRAVNGGGVLCIEGKIKNSIFTANKATNEGGGVYVSNKAVIVNSLFYKDTAATGAGVYTVGGDTLINCTLSQNHATSKGGGVWCTDQTSVVTNSILWGNTAGTNPEISGATLTYSIVKGGMTGTGNSSSDPLFIDPVHGNLRITQGSPAIDAGNNAVLNSTDTLDIEGKYRRVEKMTGNMSVSALVDMGAYEYRWGNIGLGNLTVTYNGIKRTAIVTRVPLNMVNKYTRLSIPVGPDAGTYEYKTLLTPADFQSDSLVLKDPLIIQKAKAYFVDYADSTRLYNGENQPISAGITPVIMKNEILQQYTGTNYNSAEGPVNAGVYAARSYLPAAVRNYAANDSTVALTITKAAALFVYFPDSVKKFDGQPKTLTAKISPDSLQSYVQYSYADTGSSNFQAVPPIHVGMYQVKGYLANHPNYNDVDEIAILTIEKATLQIVNYNDSILTYNGFPQPITAELNFPVLNDNIRYAYTGINGTDYALSNIPPVEVGVYSVKAFVVGNNDYNSVDSTVVLTINKARPVFINFVDTAMLYDGLAKAVTAHTLPASLEDSIQYIYTGFENVTYGPSGEAPVEVGEYTVKASIQGLKNYEDADSTIHLLIVNYSGKMLLAVTINGEQVPIGNDNTIRYSLACNDTTTTAPVVLFLASKSTVVEIPGMAFVMEIPSMGGLLSKHFTVKSNDSTKTEEYTLYIERPFIYDSIVGVKWNNTLMLNLKTLRLAGYKVSSCQWYRNGVPIPGATATTYSAGPKREDTLAKAAYHVELTFEDGMSLGTCDKVVSLQKSYGIRLYPNPVISGGVVNLDFGNEEIESGWVKVYSLSGALVGTKKITTSDTTIGMPYSKGIYVLEIVQPNGNTTSLQVLVQ